MPCVNRPATPRPSFIIERFTAFGCLQRAFFLFPWVLRPVAGSFAWGRRGGVVALGTKHFATAGGRGLDRARNQPESGGRRRSAQRRTGESDIVVLVVPLIRVVTPNTRGQL